jgi:hypothetical protein
MYSLYRETTAWLYNQCICYHDHAFDTIDATAARGEQISHLSGLQTSYTLLIHGENAHPDLLGDRPRWM